MGDSMRESKKIDFTKLLGFETISEQASKGLDFQDETISAKLGAKIGPDPVPAPRTPPRDADKR
jgi:hypothetical protein